jgi:VCBS repeat-containing protein
LFWHSRRGPAAPKARAFPQADLLWALGSVSALHRAAFSADLIAREFPGEGSVGNLVHAARTLGFHIKTITVSAAKIARLPLPVVVILKGDDSTDRLGLITAATDEAAVLFEGGTNTPKPVTLADLDARLAGTGWIIAPQVQAANDADAKAGRAAGVTRQFGFSWFGPELLRHRKVWRDVLLASLALQLVALATPLFTQAIVDKVVVHRTESTLLAIAAVMAILVMFNAVLSWGRQYLVLHTGNRVDAVLGAAVWDHLLKLPASYFERRPTGVVAARLHAVENIREFVSGAAISLLLDLPFLLICLAVMLSYSALLTALCVGVVLVIGIASLVMAPIFQKQLNEQFMLGARNQAFVTEHIAGFETVKTLQMEPQLRQRYSGYLATYLASGFRTKQIGNTYVFSRGDGHDTVDDNAGGQLYFSGDIRPEELSYRADASDLLIRVGEPDSSNGMQVTLRGWLDAGAERISAVSFCTEGVAAALDDFVLMKPRGDLFTVAPGAASVVGNLLDNDADPVFRDRLSLSFPSAWSGELGAAAASPDGSFAYTLDTASLEFKALGQGQSFTESLGFYSSFDTVTGRWLGDSAVQVDVLGVNDGPVAQADVAAVGEDDVLFASGNVLANDSDIDAGDTLTVSDAGSRAGQYGTLVLDSQGGYAYSLANSSAAVQALSAGQMASEVFAYTVSDQHGATSTAQLTVEIAGRDEAAGVTLTGTNRNDRLIGTDYADVIDGAKGADTLIGGKGDDTYFVDASSGTCSDADDRDEDHDEGHGADRGDSHDDDRDRSSGDTVVELRNGGVDTVASSVNYVLPQNVENLMLLGSASLVASGNGQANIMVGSAGATTLLGGGGNDVLVGRSAADTLNGGSGDDKLYGEGGNDKLSGADGADQLWGGSGNDVLDAGGGENLIAAGAGDDIISSASGSDVVVAGAGADRIATGAGNDVVDGGTGNDTIDTGNGSDFIAAGKGADVVTAGAGRDVIAFNRGDGQDTLLATSGSGAADVLSLGGGIRYADLTLTRRGTDLILGLGAADQVTSKNWYTGQDSKTITTLQVVTVGGDYNAASTNKLLDNKVVAFDFTAITQQYDAARKANASLGAWALQPALNSAFIGASNTSALGGDLAFDYATTYTTTQGYGTDMTVDAVRKEAKEQTGNNWQAVTTLPGAASGPTVVDPWVALQAGTDLIVSKEASASNPITPTSSPATDSLLLAALAASTDVPQPSWAVK